MIEFNDFSFTYWGQEKAALRRLNLHIGDGEFVLLAGPSGSGKSSLCRCINGLIPHFHGGRLSGTVTVNGLSTESHQPHEFATRVGMVFQDPESQLVGTDVERDIAFGLENLGVAPSKIETRVTEALDVLGIATLRKVAVNALSGGEKQKVALAAALAVRPRVLVLDEPSSELDPESAEGLLSLISGLHERLGLTIVLVEHRLERVVQYVDRMVVMVDGAVSADGAARDVLGSACVADEGIGVPPIVKVAEALRAKGLWNGVTPLDVDEARDAFTPLLRSAELRSPVARTVTDGSPIIHVESLCYQYEEERPVLSDVSLVVNPGELLAVMGRNASGKSTLVKHFNGLLKPRKGQVTVNGTVTDDVSVAALARTVGFVFQNPNDHLFCDTVEDEILFTLKHLGVQPREARERMERTLDEFGLLAYRNHYPRALSGGERQRVALASVVAAEPAVLVLDEPTRGLEYGLKQRLMSFLRHYVARGNAVVLVTHDVETVAAYADRVVLLDDGMVLREGQPRAVMPCVPSFAPQVSRLVHPFLKDGDGAGPLTAAELVEALT
ncbi:MAG: ABC transporter ATP-binding protein [Dehalococcoidia bacterium]|nr:ABC transporter ATP-binding protein [Dehalococcoidia bacterium]